MTSPLSADLVDVDADLARDLVSTFLETEPPRMSQLRQTVLKREGAAVVATAHSLRGATRIFDANNLVAELYQLETHARGGEWERALSTLQQAERSFGLLQDRLQAWISAPAP